MKALLSDSLKRLRLSGLAASLDVRLQEAKSNRLDHIEFLELILQDELAVRQERAITRRTTPAPAAPPPRPFVNSGRWRTSIGISIARLRGSRSTIWRPVASFVS